MDGEELEMGVFLVRARRCRRCGGLLTGAEAVRDGIGHVCKRWEKEEREARQWERENQCSLWPD